MPNMMAALPHIGGEEKKKKDRNNHRMKI